MKTLRILGVMVLVVLIGRPGSVRAQVTPVHAFDSGNFGDYDPLGRLVRCSCGYLYGTTSEGGIDCLDGCKSGYGAIYGINPGQPGGDYFVAHIFSGSDGKDPSAGLIQGLDGYLYGMTFAGGANDLGTAFRIDVFNNFAKLYDFSGPGDGANPRGRLYRDTDGSFYGTTYAGGFSDMGTVFQITSAGTLTPLYLFHDADGAHPIAGLVGLQGAPGALYGTTVAGGTNGEGTVFKITSAGTLTTLHQFGDPADATDGAEPWGGLVQGSDGNLFGTTARGGTNFGGTVFRITPQGMLTTLYQFSGLGTEGAEPQAGLVLGSDGNFWGSTTYGGNYQLGTVFKINQNGLFLISLWSFGGLEGAHPIAGLVQHFDGNFYGTTQHGGGSTNCNSGCGALFKLLYSDPLPNQIVGAQITTNGGFAAKYALQYADSPPTNGVWNNMGTPKKAIGGVLTLTDTGAGLADTANLSYCDHTMRNGNAC